MHVSSLPPAAHGSKFILFCFLPSNQNEAQQQCGLQTSLWEGPPAGQTVHHRHTSTNGPRISHCIPVCGTCSVYIQRCLTHMFTGQRSRESPPPPLPQKCATTFISRPAPAPEPWAWFDAWPTATWWRPELKLAHSRLVESLGDRETSGPAPSRDSVAKHAADRRDTAVLTTWLQTQSGRNHGSFSFLPAVFWSQILMVLSWEDVATWAAPPGGTGRNTQEAVVWRWPLYSTTLQPGWRRSQSLTQRTQWGAVCVGNRRVPWS